MLQSHACGVRTTIKGNLLGAPELPSLRLRGLFGCMFGAEFSSHKAVSHREGREGNGVPEEARHPEILHVRGLQLRLSSLRRSLAVVFAAVFARSPGHPRLCRPPRISLLLRRPRSNSSALRLLQSGSDKIATLIQTPVRHEYTSMRSMNERNVNESKYGFWGVLARKAMSILEEDGVSQQFNNESFSDPQMLETSKGIQLKQPLQSPEHNRKAENLASSLNYIGGTIKNAIEEGLMIVENRTADIIQGTKKLQIRRKSMSFNPRNQIPIAPTEDPSQNQSDKENQLKASRDVANVMAAKAKLLLRELKSLKADLAFVKERCTQLEDENKLLRESRPKDDSTQDDDLIRLQLETLLAEKGRLAHENSMYARENRFLREIVEFHQLTMQDVMYLEDAIDEDVSEAGNIQISSPNSSLSASDVISPAISSPHSPSSLPDAPPSQNTDVAEPESDHTTAPVSREEDSSPKFDESPRHSVSSS
ncbi:hypothetical protein AXF42_Ash008349 [Apostasia shenzhenica]|uniref:Uncharacterized protein n=1 Tax=Apostasia shenzhenica TaxID=1088818 RepID=A0A2I0AXL4_9ASPA|nr:hypothetical protein AXF42_Ash008349 [Apostasia shenzhenica]